MKRSFKEGSKGSFTVSTGWLFADMLLILAMLFIAANTVEIRLPTAPPPILIVSPTNLNLKSCIGGTSNPRCTVTIEESTSSQGNMDWMASSDMSDTVLFSPDKGTLSPGKSVNVSISAFPCQNGSFTFSGSRESVPATVLWRCTPPPNDRILEHEYCRIQLVIGSPVGFINDDINTARRIVEPQLNQVRFLQGRQVGIAIAYGGTIGGTEGQGTDVATQVYNVLKVLAKDQRAQMYSVLKTTSWYEPLFTGLERSNTTIINVYLVVRPNNPKDTCNEQHNPIS